jgi:hypothetical protein
MERQRAFARLQLFIEVIATLFVAGGVVPGVVRSGLATHQALAAGALRTMHIGELALSYTYQNVAAAILGGLVGAMVACAIHFRSGRPIDATSGRAISLREPSRNTEMTSRGSFCWRIPKVAD